MSRTYASRNRRITWHHEEYVLNDVSRSVSSLEGFLKHGTRRSAHWRPGVRQFFRRPNACATGAAR